MKWMPTGQMWDLVEAPGRGRRIRQWAPSARDICWRVPKEIPAALMATVDGAMHQAAKALVQQITGGSLSIRATGAAGMRVAGAAARDMMIKAAAVAYGRSPNRN